MRDIDHVIALSTEVSSLREALAKKERELAALLREKPRGGEREPNKTTPSKADETAGRKARKPGRGAIMESIREALASSEEPLRVAEIAVAVDANPVSVATMVKRLLARGQARRVAKGRYSAA